MKKGRLAALYLLIYAVVRFSLEFIRGDHVDFFFGVFTEAQIVSFLAFPIGLFMFWYCGKNDVVEPTEDDSDSEEETTSGN